MIVPNKGIVAKIPANIQTIIAAGPSKPAVKAEAMYMSAPTIEPTTIFVRSKYVNVFSMP